MTQIRVFYKDRPPAMKTLTRVKELLSKRDTVDNISYHLITDPASAEHIQRYGLPETHFPFAIVINGRFCARVGERVVAFVHFPTFMHGIGRHEGNWSLEDLAEVLENPDLLLDHNRLPELGASTTACGD